MNPGAFTVFEDKPIKPEPIISLKDIGEVSGIYCKGLYTDEELTYYNVVLKVIDSRGMDYLVEEASRVLLEYDNLVESDYTSESWAQMRAHLSETSTKQEAIEGLRFWINQQKLFVNTRSISLTPQEAIDEYVRIADEAIGMLVDVEEPVMVNSWTLEGSMDVTDGATTQYSVIHGYTDGTSQIFEFTKDPYDRFYLFSSNKNDIVQGDTITFNGAGARELTYVNTHEGLVLASLTVNVKEKAEASIIKTELSGPTQVKVGEVATYKLIHSFSDGTQTEELLGQDKSAYLALGNQVLDGNQVKFVKEGTFTLSAIKNDGIKTELASLEIKVEKNETVNNEPKDESSSKEQEDSGKNSSKKEEVIVTNQGNPSKAATEPNKVKELPKTGEQVKTSWVYAGLSCLAAAVLYLKRRKNN